MPSLAFFNDAATPEVYSIPLHDALPILSTGRPAGPPAPQSLLTAASQAERVAGGVSVMLLKYSARNCPCAHRVTMTLMLAVAVRPTPSRTRRLSVWLPAATGVVSQKNE